MTYSRHVLHVVCTCCPSSMGVSLYRSTGDTTLRSQTPALHGGRSRTAPTASKSAAHASGKGDIPVGNANGTAPSSVRKTLVMLAESPYISSAQQFSTAATMAFAPARKHVVQQHRDTSAKVSVIQCCVNLASDIWAQGDCRHSCYTRMTCSRERDKETARYASATPAGTTHCVGCSHECLFYPPQPCMPLR